VDRSLCGLCPVRDVHGGSSWRSLESDRGVSVDLSEVASRLHERDRSSFVGDRRAPMHSVVFDIQREKAEEGCLSAVADIPGLPSCVFYVLNWEGLGISDVVGG